MKKSLITAFATLSISICVSANKGIVLNNSLDSINYAFGYMNGIGIKNQIIGADTTDAKLVNIFIQGFNDNFKETETINRIYIEALQFGNLMSKDFNKGYIMGDSTIIAKSDIIENIIYDAVKGKKLPMEPMQANMLLFNTQNQMQNDSIRKTRTTEQIDSINTAFAIANANNVKEYILKNDSSEKAAKTFIKGVKKGLKISKKADEIKLNAMIVGTNFYEQTKETKGILNDSTLPYNHDLMKIGILHAITAYESAPFNAKSAEEYLFGEMMKKEAAKIKEKTAEGERFLADNAKKEGVITTPSGLQYKVIKMGNGAVPTTSDKVKVHYEGRLLDGTVFDSSIQRGEPISFTLNQVIEGWTEGLQLMPVGSKFIFYIPYNLAYGEQGAGGVIPPYATLIFEIELIDIEK